MPNASAVIPNYNHGRFVGNAIRSALDQVYDSYEIIVVDDGSSDNSLDEIARFGDRIRLIRQENQGLGGARNTGILAARGEIVALLDADDQWQPGFLKHMMQLASMNPEAAAVYCCARGMDSEGKELPQVFGTPPAGTEATYWTLLRCSFLIPSCMVLRRSILIAEGLFDTKLHGCEDWDLWLRLAPKYQFIGTPMRLVRYRVHSNTFSADSRIMQNAVQAVTEKHFGRDDGRRELWPREKRRAYGGVYRFRALSSVRRDDWNSAAACFKKAIEVDPTLALDRDFFYDLALGSQPSGYRGTSLLLDPESTGRCIGHLLAEAFHLPCSSELETVRRNAYGTANLALGLVAYNSGRPALSRKYLTRALRFRPGLWRDPLLLGNVGKSLIAGSVLQALREFKSKRAG